MINDRRKKDCMGKGTDNEETEEHGQKISLGGRVYVVDDDCIWFWQSFTGMANRYTWIFGMGMFSRNLHGG